MWEEYLFFIRWFLFIGFMGFSGRGLLGFGVISVLLEKGSRRRVSSRSLLGLDVRFERVIVVVV